MDVRRVAGRSDGASAVEFALVLPVLVILVFGITEFGRLFMQDQTVGNAAREGARLGVQPDATCGDVRARVVGSGGSLTLETDMALRPLAGPDAVPVCTDGVAQPCEAGGDDSILEVTVTSPDTRVAIPLVGVVVDGITRAATFRCETHDSVP